MQAIGELLQSLGISGHPYAHIHVVYWGGSAAGVGRPLSNTHASDRLLSLLFHFHGFIACSLSYPHSHLSDHTRSTLAAKTYLFYLYVLFYLYFIVFKQW